MKHSLVILVLMLMSDLSAQTTIPSFLKGTWKTENQESFEHWDSLNAHTLKGISYNLTNGRMTVIEYLDITLNESNMYYTATVPGQNQGGGIVFTLIDTTSGYSFVNPGHDFPKQIRYKAVSDTSVSVEVSDGANIVFRYNIIKQNHTPAPKDSTIINQNYDPALAQKLGADDYGMKRYILVVLKTGTNTTSDQAFIGECFRSHLDNISRLVKEGKMILAGPVGKNANAYRGIFILDVSTTEEAEQLLQTDPAIREGLLQADIYQWYGSAALPEYLKYSEKIWKVNP